MPYKVILYTELHKNPLTIHELFLTEYEFSGFIKGRIIREKKSLFGRQQGPDFYSDKPDPLPISSILLCSFNTIIWFAVVMVESLCVIRIRVLDSTRVLMAL